MNKNSAIFEFESDDNTIYALRIGKVFNAKAAPLSIEIDDGIANRADFNDWLTNRRIPASRMQIEAGLNCLSQSLNQDITTAILSEKNYYLSLSDQYWIKPNDSNVTWNEINFFTNTFSDDVGNALFDNIHSKNISLLDPVNSSDGVLKKKWIIHNGKRQLIKSGSGAISQEVFNEEIASALCKLLNIDSYVEYKAEILNGTPVSVCDCFIDENTEFVSAQAVLKHFPYNTRGDEYKSYINCCKSLGVTVTDSLDSMIVIDYLIGNTDRHYRNFGLIRDVENYRVVNAAPLFDFGTSLFWNKPDNVISSSDDIASKPFRDYHSQQIKLVKNPERFDLNKLQGFSQEAYKILNKYDIIPKQRIEILCDVLEKRIEKLKE